MVIPELKRKIKKLNNSINFQSFRVTINDKEIKYTMRPFNEIVLNYLQKHFFTYQKKVTKIQIIFGGDHGKAAFSLCI